MRFREIKEGNVVVLADGNIAEVVSKRIEAGAPAAAANIIEVCDAGGAVSTVQPIDVKRLATDDEAATFFDQKGAGAGGAHAATADEITRVTRYVRPKDANGVIGNKGVTLVIDINQTKNELTIYHSECNGETFNKQRGIEEALKKKPEVFPYNRNHTLVGHVVYMVTKAKRRKMKHLAQLRTQVKAAVASRHL